MRTMESTTRCLSPSVLCCFYLLINQPELKIAPSHAAHRSETSLKAAKGLSRLSSEKKARLASLLLRLGVARPIPSPSSLSLLTSTPSLEAGFCSGASAAGTLIVVVDSSSLEEPSSTTSSVAPPARTRATVALTHSSASALAVVFPAAAAGRTHTSVPLVCSEAVAAAAAAGAAPAMMAHKVEERRRKDRKKERKKEERWLFEKKTKSEKNEGDSLLTLLSLKPALLSLLLFRKVDYLSFVIASPSSR